MQFLISFEVRVQFSWRAALGSEDLKPLFELFEGGDVARTPQAQGKQGRLGGAPKIYFPRAIALDELLAQEFVQGRGGVQFQDIADPGLGDSALSPVADNDQ